MEKKEMKRVKLDDALREMLKPPLPPNVFIRSHKEGLIVAVPKLVAVCIFLSRKVKLIDFS